MLKSTQFIAVRKKMVDKPDRNCSMLKFFEGFFEKNPLQNLSKVTDFSQESSEDN